MFLYDLTKALDKERVPYAIVGGYAVALHGVVRATMDIDLVISLLPTHLKKAESVLKKLGLSSRLPIQADDIIKFRREYIEKRNLIAWSFIDYKDPTRVVDLLITYDTVDIEIIKIKIGGHTLKIASLDSLIQMKKASGRPQDIIDFKNLEKLKNGSNKK